MTDEDISGLGFTPWSGGPSPVNDDTLVEAMFILPPAGPDQPEGHETKIRQAKEFRWSWVAGGTGGDIIGYRPMQFTPQ